MISLATSRIRRVSAHYSPMWRVGLAARTAQYRVKFVVAVPLGAETHCLNRYPSPKGRTGCPQGRPPRFFVQTSKFCAIRQTAADAYESRKICFQWNPKHVIPLIIRRTERGKSSCADQSRLNSRPCRRSPSLSPVVTRRWNRLSWVAAPVRPHLWFSTAMSQPALSLARRPMSPTARSTRRAANADTLNTPASAGFTICTAIAGHSPRGGRFYSYQ